MPKVKPLEKVQLVVKVDEAVVLRIEGDRSTLLPLVAKRPKGAPAPARKGIFEDPGALQVIATTLLQLGTLLGRRIGELENQERAELPRAGRRPPPPSKHEHDERPELVHQRLRAMGADTCLHCNAPLGLNS